MSSASLHQPKNEQAEEEMEEIVDSEWEGRNMDKTTKMRAKHVANSIKYGNPRLLNDIRK